MTYDGAGIEAGTITVSVVAGGVEVVTAAVDGDCGRDAPVAAGEPPTAAGGDALVDVGVPTSADVPDAGVVAAESDEAPADSGAAGVVVEAVVGAVGSGSYSAAALAVSAAESCAKARPPNPASVITTSALAASPARAGRRLVEAPVVLMLHDPIFVA